tara:strand:- start:596 stop:1282 length:687 start_codon:yes stop_codon:yes gene_type:complete
MNTQLISKIPCKIKYDIPISAFTQNNEAIVFRRQFLDKFTYFDSTKNSNKVETICLPGFIDMLMYTTNDFMFSKDDFRVHFEQQLETCTPVLKEITHKHRQLKNQIMEILEDKSYICDFPNCMKFFSELLKVSLIVIVDDKYLSQHKNELYSKTLVIEISDKNSYDFHYNKAAVEQSKYGPYISHKLMENLCVNELQMIYSKLYKTSAKTKKKNDMIADLTQHLSQCE